MMDVIMRTFDDADALADQAAAHLSDHLDEALTQRGRASLMLSGGSSPKPIYQKLAQATLAWNGVGIGLMDERWVPSGADGSNADFIRDCFTGSPAEHAHIVPLYNAHPTAADGVEAAKQALDLMAQPFDICVMGMGLDGHTASWFPRSGGLEAALDPNDPATVCAIDASGCEVAGQHTDRITLSYSAIAAARHVMLVLPSVEKLDVFWQTLSRDVLDAPVKALTKLGDRLTVFAVGDEK